MKGLCVSRAKLPWLLLRQMSTMVQLKEMGLFRSQGLIDGIGRMQKTVALFQLTTQPLERLSLLFRL